MKTNPFKNKKYSYVYRKKSPSGKQKKKSNLFSAIKKGKSKNTADNFEYPKKKPLLGGKAVYVDSYRTITKRVWILPIVIVVLITALVFWIGPLILSAISESFAEPDESGKSPGFLYRSGDWMVVSVQKADVFDKGDLRARRITQALYNEPVKVLDRDTFGFVHVKLENSTKGYIMERDLVLDTTSAEPAFHAHKIVVTAKSKRIMTHSSRGSLVMEAATGTALFSDYRTGNVYRVVLPGGNHGWISASGIIRIEPGGQIEKSSAKNFYETALSYNNAVYLQGGITPEGACVEGIAYISAKINGVDIPPVMEGQIRAGEKVDLAFNEETGVFELGNIEEGDLIFFGDTKNPERTITRMGIVVGYGQILTYSRATSSIRILRFDNDPDLAGSIIEVRRLF